MSSSDFEYLLDSLQSNDNSERKRAEDLWNSYKSSGDASGVLSSIMRVLEDDRGDEAESSMRRRSLVAVLLRGIVLRDTELLLSPAVLPPETFAQLRHSLLLLLVSEPLPFVRRQIAHIVAPLAKLEPWSEIYDFLPQLADPSSHPSQHVLCFFLLDKLAEYVGPHLLDNLPAVCAMLEPVFASISSPSSPSPYSHTQTQAAAICAAISLLHEIPDPQLQLVSSVSPLLSSLPLAQLLMERCASEEDTESFGAVCESLGRLLDSSASLFKEPSLCESLFFTARNVCLSGSFSDDSIKCGMLEIMVKLLTSTDSAPFCCNEQSRAGCISLCVEVLCGVDIPETCSETYLLAAGCPGSDLLDGDAFGDEDDSDEEPAIRAAGDILGAVFSKWPIEETIATCLEIVGQLFENGSVGALRTALFVTSRLYDLLGVEMQQHLASLAPILFQLLDHEHPRIRLCVLLCMKSLILSEYDEDEEGGNEEESDDGDGDSGSGGGFRMIYHDTFFPAIMRSVGENLQLPRVVCQCVNTWRSFCDPQTCPTALVSAHTQQVLEMAWTFLSKKDEFPSLLLEECVPLIGNISLIDPDAFLPHYPNFMSVLSGILMSGGTHDLSKQKLKGKCLECCALFGTSVGYDIFLKDAFLLLEFMIDCQNSVDFDATDPMSSYISQACARIAGVLGDAFEPYLHRVVPPLLSTISQDIEHDVQLEDLQQQQLHSREGGEGDGEHITIYKRGAGNIRYYFNSHAIKEKEMRLRTLFQYVIDIPHLMFPFSHDIVQAVACISSSRCTEDILMIIGAILNEACKVWLRFFEWESDETSSTVSSALIESGLTYLTLSLQEATKLSSETENHDFSITAVDNVRMLLQIVAERMENRNISSLWISAALGGAVFMGLKDQVDLWLARKFNPHAEYREDTSESELGDDLWLGVTDAMGYLFKSMTPLEACELFNNEMLPYLCSFLDMEAVESCVPLLSMVLSVLTDCVEVFISYSSTSASFSDTIEKIISIMAENLVFRYCDNEHLMVLCAYGIGACSCHTSWRSYAEKSLFYLKKILQVLESAEEFDEDLKGTVVSALFKLSVFQSNSVVLSDVLSSLLPMTCCPYEARECHTLLVDLMALGDQRLIGPEGENLAQLFFIVAQLCLMFDQASKVSPATQSLRGVNLSEQCDFWNERFVPEFFDIKIKKMFMGDLVCGFEKSSVISIIKCLPSQHVKILVAFSTTRK